MKIAFTTSSLPVSRFIRWGLKEDVSHVIYVFDDKIVFHCSFLGCKIEWYNDYKKHVTVVEEIEYDLPLEIEESIYQSIIDENYGNSYDFKAFAYFTYTAVAHRFFGKPMPTTNKWSDSNRFICTALAAKLPKEYFPQLDGVDLEIMSPGQLRDLLKK